MLCIKIIDFSLQLIVMIVAGAWGPVVGGWGECLYRGSRMLLVLDNCISTSRTYQLYYRVNCNRGPV